MLKEIELTDDEREFLYSRKGYRSPVALLNAYNKGLILSLECDELPQGTCMALDRLGAYLQWTQNVKGGLGNLLAFTRDTFGTFDPSKVLRVATATSPTTLPTSSGAG